MIPSTHTHSIHPSINNEELDFDPHIVFIRAFPLKHGKARRVWMRKRNAIERRIESRVEKKNRQLSKCTYSVVVKKT